MGRVMRLCTEAVSGGVERKGWTREWSGGAGGKGREGRESRRGEGEREGEGGGRRESRREGEGGREQEGGGGRQGWSVSLALMGTWHGDSLPKSLASFLQGDYVVREATG